MSSKANATPASNSNTIRTGYTMRQSRGYRNLIAGGIGLLAVIGIMANLKAQGTLSAAPYLTVYDSSGNPVNGAKVCTYTSGTSTPIATYTNAALTVANTNPIVTDASGRYVAFLSPGTSYRFVIYSNDGTANTCNGTTLRTQDNIQAVPTSANNIDVTGVAGEALTADQAVYLSDGSGSTNAGQWYRANATNAYSSLNTIIGMVPADITSGNTGTIRLAGTMDSLSGLVAGDDYYLSAATAGAITATPPTNARRIGRATSTTAMTVIANPAVPTSNDYVCGRATLTSLVPVTTADVTSATTIYYTPYGCNLISLYDGAEWNPRVLAQLSASVPAVASTNYDLFVYDNAGTPTIEVGSAWSSATAIYSSGIYATTRPLQNGRWVKSTNGTAIDATRRYVATFRTEPNATGYTDDSQRLRFVFNAYNRVPRSLVRLETVSSWTYTTATYRQANANPYNQVEVVRGLDDEVVDLGVFATGVNASTAVVGVTISVDTTNPLTSIPVALAELAAQHRTAVNRYVGLPGLGYHYLTWLEISQAAGTSIWYANNAAVVVGGAYGAQSGLAGSTRQ